MPCLHFPDQITRWLPLGLLSICTCTTMEQDFDGYTTTNSFNINFAILFKYNYIYTKTCLPLQLALLNALEQDIAIRIWVDGVVVKRIELASPVEHILVDLAVCAAQTAVQDPVVKAPGIHKPDSVWPNLLEQVHDSVGPRERNLVLAACAGSVEFGALLLKCVQSEETEQLHQHVDNVLVDVACFCNVPERRQIVLYDHVLCVGLAEAVEVDEQIVPGLLLLVAVLAGFEGEERYAPSKGIDEVVVVANNVECAANVATCMELRKDLSGVVRWLFALEYGTGGLEHLEHRSVRTDCSYMR